MLSSSIMKQHQWILQLPLLLLLLLLLLLQLSFTASAKSQAAAKRPNILILLADDLGFGDVGANGNDTIRTPNIDRLAREGVRFTQHLTAAPVCTPSRAALLTGKYPIRIGMVPANRMQVFPFIASQGGLPPNLTTFAKVAQGAGYNTALIGKWHLGAHCTNSKDFCHHPNNHGFDYFYGCLLTLLKDFSGFGESVMLSNFPRFYVTVVGSLLAAMATLWLVARLQLLSSRLCLLLSLLCLAIVAFVIVIPSFGIRLVNSQIHRQHQLVEQPIRFEKLTQRLVWEGQEFIDNSLKTEKPFLLFMSYLQVHTPLYNSVPGFAGRSRHGPYGDNVEELDWSVGQILDFLDSRGLADNTVVYFSSDNGGHVEEVTHEGFRGGGHNAPWRGGKCQGSPDGGIRVPAMVRWPGVAAAGRVSDALTSQMDLYPTLVSAMGAQTPDGLDGRDLRQLLQRPDSPDTRGHEFLFQYCGQLLHAVRYSSARYGLLKLRFYSPRWQPGSEGCGYVCQCQEGTDAVRHEVPVLRNLTTDPSERSAPLPASSEQYRSVVPLMLQAVREHQEQLQEQPSEFTFSKLVWRPWLQDCCNFPKCNCRDEKFDDRQ